MRGCEVSELCDDKFLFGMMDLCLRSKILSGVENPCVAKKPEASE